MKIVTDRLSKEEIATIQQIAPHAEIVKADTEEDLLREIADAEVILGPKLVPAQLAHARTVKWIQVAGVGIDRMISPEFVASDIVLTNSKGKTSVNIAGLPARLRRESPRSDSKLLSSRSSEFFCTLLDSSDGNFYHPFSENHHRLNCRATKTIELGRREWYFKKR